MVWKVINQKFLTSMSNSSDSESMAKNLPKKITVATPMYGGQCCVDYVQGLMNLQRLCQQTGVELHTDFIANESLITRARNTMVAKFLSSDSDYLIFIDADIGFAAESVFKCIMSGLDVCGVAYPMKGFSGEKFAREIQNLRNTGEEIDFNTLLRRSLPSALNLIALDKDGNKEIKLSTKGEFLEVSKIGTGFMCIKREVLEKMIVEYPRSYKNDVSGYDNNIVYHTLFDTEIEDERFLSEDFAFCSKWRRMGGQVYVYLFSNLLHTGFYKFHGTLLDSFDPELRTVFLQALNPQKPPPAAPAKFSKRKIAKGKERKED